MKFTLKIDLGNDAMCRPVDVSAALECVAESLSRHSFTVLWNETDPFDRKGGLRDANGNIVGEWNVTA